MSRLRTGSAPKVDGIGRRKAEAGASILKSREEFEKNSGGWQWAAGSGADAAPYFRVFNPILQGEKFDKQGDYVKQYCPELSRVPDKYIHKPWEAPPKVLHNAGIVLGKDYPQPIVDLKTSRQRALDAYQQVKG